MRYCPTVSKHRARHGHASKQPHLRDTHRGIFVGNTPILWSPLTDLRSLRHNIAQRFTHYEGPPRSWWIWAPSCIVLLVLSIKPGGFLFGALLRLVMLGGGVHIAADARRQSNLHPRDTSPVSLGCSLTLIAILVIAALAIGGLVMQAFGAK